MSGTSRPQFVLFGSSIVQFGFFGDGWAANLAHLYARKVPFFFFSFFLQGSDHNNNDAFCSRDFELNSTLFRKFLTCMVILCMSPFYLMKISFTWTLKPLLAQADIINRGYAGWNTRRALQVLDKVFPKVYSSLQNLRFVHWKMILRSLKTSCDWFLCQLVEFRMLVYNPHWLLSTLVAMILRSLTQQDSVLLCLSKSISRTWRRSLTISRFLFSLYPFLLILVVTAEAWPVYERSAEPLGHHSHYCTQCSSHQWWSA